MIREQGTNIQLSLIICMQLGMLHISVRMAMFSCYYKLNKKQQFFAKLEKCVNNI